MIIPKSFYWEISQLQTKYKYLQNKIRELNLTIAKVSLEKRKKTSKCLKFFKPTVFITKNKVHIYDSNGETVDTWNKHVTFTSYIKEGNKLKITGYFVNKKFKSALNKDWWINVNDVEKKFKEKN
ncbi:hypothetical protein [Nautilia profundicola]|uniref:hypothetical protein n=1 Tax=Nautilia profundicola TaxID=244787 RepID=UPI00117E065C|nr:hypothetical protein [Nautilia profundicola]